MPWYLCPTMSSGGPPEAEAIELSRALRIQAVVCERMGSPFYRGLLERMADDVDAGGPAATVLAAHRRTRFGEAIPLRVLGGLHRIVLSGAAADLETRFPSTGGDGDAAAAWSSVRRLLADPPAVLVDAL